MTVDWYMTKLKKVFRDYKPADIFNADESGLFYKLLPNRSLVLKGDACHGGKNSKERITILPCANMTGTEKWPLPAIGKAAKPVFFKGILLWFDKKTYGWNGYSETWLEWNGFTGPLEFTVTRVDCISEFERKFCLENISDFKRKILANSGTYINYSAMTE